MAGMEVFHFKSTSAGAMAGALLIPGLCMTLIAGGVMDEKAKGSE